jgi:hypothetical protein
VSELGSRVATYYKIRIEETLGCTWAVWFDGLRVTRGTDGHTSISDPVPDQAALHGLLAKVRDLGLVLVEVRRVDEGHPASFPTELTHPGHPVDGQGRRR